MKYLLSAILLVSTLTFAQESPVPLKDSPIISDPLPASIVCDAFIEYYETGEGTTIHHGTFNLSTVNSEYGRIEVDLHEKLKLPDTVSEASFSVSTNTAGAFLDLISPHLIIGERKVYSSDHDYSVEIDTAKLQVSNNITLQDAQNNFIIIDSSVNCTFESL